MSRLVLVVADEEVALMVLAGLMVLVMVGDELAVMVSVIGGGGESIMGLVRCSLAPFPYLYDLSIATSWLYCMAPHAGVNLCRGTTPSH